MIRILSNFLNDAATITSSSEVSGLPDDNVVDDFVTRVWRSSMDTDLKAYLPLSEEHSDGTTLYDLAEYDNDGTSANTPTFTTGPDGSTTGAMRFNGTDDYVDVADNASLDITNAITVSAWVNRGSSNVQHEQLIVSKGFFGNTTQPWSIYIRPTYNYVRFYVNGYNDTTAGMGSTTYDLGSEEWHHIVGVYDGSHVYIYIDGSVGNSVEAFTDPIDTNNLDIRIGARPDTYFYGFDGSIADACVYSRALSPEEVKALYTTGPVSEYVKFDLGSAKQITEVGLFGHNLTSGATVTIEGNASDSWAVPDYTTTIAWNEESMVEFIDKTYQWWRITFDDAANPDRYIEIGRICMGAYYEPSINITDNVQKSWNDPSFIEMSQGRQAHVIERSIYRVYAVNFSLIPRAQQTELETIFRAIGKTGYCVVSLDPDTYPSDDSIYGLLTTNLSAALTALEYGDVSLTFEEKVR